MEQKEWERIVRNRPILHRVAGNEGGELYTDELLFTYLEQFEKDISETSAHVINATEGGARIRGTSVMTLRDVTEQFCANEIDPDRFAYREATNWCEPTKLEPTRLQFEQRVSELDSVIEVCKELLVQFPMDTRAQYEQAVTALWEQPHREEKYTAIALARDYPDLITMSSVPLYKRMIREGAWWDLVDEIAAHLIGHVLRLLHAVERHVDRSDRYSTPWKSCCVSSGGATWP